MKWFSCKRSWVYIFIILVSISLVFSLAYYNHQQIALAAPVEQENSSQPTISGPFTPTRYDGSLLDLPVIESEGAENLVVPEPGNPKQSLPIAEPGFMDPLAQISFGEGQMPEPIMNFPGVIKAQAGGWIPPDTNGDVGPAHYIQVVNVGIGIFNKFTGEPLYVATYNTFFAPAPPPCNTQNRGDVIALYDSMADRWLVTDFSLPAGGPYYQCIAISQAGDPVSGGWYYYAFQVENPYGSWHDYPKLGVWPDAYYMSANMFDPWSGAQVWAFDRAAMLQGLPLTAVSFLAGTAYGSLLPSNLRGPLPPEGSPNYFASIDYPNVLHIWEFHVDWVTPGNSTFTGPVDLTVEEFGIINDIPQPSPGSLLDSLGERLMMQLQYRNFGTYEALYVNHTVASGGTAGIRWYEVRDPGNLPEVFQQGTYQPDQDYRWMGSIAADQDGNLALGYSVASGSLKPAIRYSGRLFGETLGTLPQSETSLIEGSGVQIGSNRWGDYSAMTVDPIDDCTFWYTQEYLLTNSSNWVTQIGSFKFPSCGKPKGTISGVVYDALTDEPIPNVMVTAEGITTTLTTETDASGSYEMLLPANFYTLMAGPKLPGYPNPVVIENVEVVVGQNNVQDFILSSVPVLVEVGVVVDDNVLHGNGNGIPEPNEREVKLWETIGNTNTMTATNVTAHLSAITPGVEIISAETSYPDIAYGEQQVNELPFVISIAPTVTCGTELEFVKFINTDQGDFTLTFSINASIQYPPVSLFSDDMENGVNGWTTGGTTNWSQTTGLSHSPTHSWTDSPSGPYANDTNSWLKSPELDGNGKRGFELSFWHRYQTENGWDFGYVEYSIDGGSTWTGVKEYTGNQTTWTEQNIPLTYLDNQDSVMIRYRLTSDTYITDDGWYIDDFNLTYVPFECTFPLNSPGVPTLVTPQDGTKTTNRNVTFIWESGDGETPEGYIFSLDETPVMTFTTPITSTEMVLAPGSHTWSVAATNLAGASAFSDVWHLDVWYLSYMPVVIR